MDMKHIEILKNLNTRFVLIRNDGSFIIMDKLRHMMTTINDPYIDIQKLHQDMINNGVQIFNTIGDLPPIKEFPTSLSEIKPIAFKAFIRKVFNQRGNETGSVVTAMTNEMINREEKLRIEKILEHYALQVLYPNEGINIFSSIHNDTASISVIRDINNLPYEDVENKELYSW